MDPILTNWLLLAIIQAAATISPGPDFAMAVRNSIAYGRRTGIFTALGFSLGAGTHVWLVLFGFSVLIAQSVFLFNLVKYAGAAWLIYIGTKALLMKKENKTTASCDTATDHSQTKTMTTFEAIRCGYLTNLLNPKAVVFFTAVYAQFVAPHTPPEIQVLYCLTTVLITAAWFSLVAAVLTIPQLRIQFLKIRHWIECTCGAAMIALGLRLALTKATVH